jgi:hypothetical protein
LGRSEISRQRRLWVSRAATNKLIADMAHEHRPYNVAVISLYPDLVRTEAIMAAATFLGLSTVKAPSSQAMSSSRLPAILP